MSHPKERAGFSLLELALVIAVLAIISIMAIGISTSSIERNRLRSIENVITQGIRRAHQRSLHNVGGDTWGIYFCMPLTDLNNCKDIHGTMPSVIIFTGSSLTPGGVYQVIETSPDTSFSGPVFNDAVFYNGLVFRQLTGEICKGVCQMAGNSILNALSGSLIIESQHNLAVLTISEKGIVEH